MIRNVLGLSLFLGLCLGLLALLDSSSVLAGKGQKGKEPEDLIGKKRPKESEASKVLANIDLANQLIDYGIANRSPAALLTAAEILHNNPTEDTSKGKLVFKTEGVEAVKNDSQPRTAKNVLAMAKKMAKELETKEFNSLIVATAKRIQEEPRSPCPGGCYVRKGCLHGGHKATYWVHCHGHNHANVHPHFHHKHVDLDLYVYDSHGHLVRYDRRTCSSASVHWHGHGEYRVVVHMYTPSGHCNYTLRVS